MEEKEFALNDENFKIADFYNDENDIIQDYDFIKHLINLRDFQCISFHQLIIEKEITCFLANDFPNLTPYYKKISLLDIEKFKNQINNCESFDYERLNLSEKTIKEINSIIMNNTLSIINKNSSNISLNSEKNGNFSETKNNNKIIKNKVQSNDINEENHINNSEEIENSKKVINFNFNIDTHNKSKSNNQNNISNTENMKDSNNDEQITQKSNSNNKSIDSNNNTNENIIFNDKYFCINEYYENIKHNTQFNYYTPNVNFIGKSYEGEIINNLFDIFNSLTMRKLNFLRNKEYEYTFKIKYGNELKDKKVKYEFDFQISNLNLKDFLYFIGLIFPNISSLNTLTEPLKSQISKIFENEETIFQDIENVNIDEKLKEYKYVDIIGEITTNIFNIEKKKNNQLNKYFLLAKELKENPEMNKKFNFLPNNKKIIIVITNGTYKNFYENFNKNINKTVKIDDNYADIDLIFIYEKMKNGEDHIIQDKFKVKYINMLENALEKKQNGDINLGIYKKLKFSELYNNFYKYILINNNAQELRKEFAYINRKYIYSLPSSYFKFLNKKIDRNQITDIFLNNIKLNIIPNNEYITKIKKEFNEIKENFIPTVSILEITSLDLLLENYHDEKITILYKHIKYIKYGNNMDMNEIENKFNLWLNENEFNIKIVVFNTIKNDNSNLFFFFIFNKFIQNNYSLFIRKNDNCNIVFSLLKQYIKFDDINDLKNNLDKLIESKKYEQFLKRKMNHQFNYYSKILNNHIIIKNGNEMNNNYLDNFISQINQEISIYTNLDITKINNNFFNNNNLKKMIQDLNQFNIEFIENEKQVILNAFNKTQCLKDFVDANIKIEDSLNTKFKRYQKYLELMYYKFIEIFYSKRIKKKIQKLIINDYVNI